MPACLTTEKNEPKPPFFPTTLTPAAMSAPEISHGRGGAGNINPDNTEYADAEIVRAGEEGSAVSTGRGGMLGAKAGDSKVSFLHTHGAQNIGRASSREPGLISPRGAAQGAAFSNKWKKQDARKEAWKGAMCVALWPGGVFVGP